jgi:hypothetical protein
MNTLEIEVKERKVGDAQSAHTLYTKMQKHHEEREKGFALIENQINGGKPYDPAKLAQQGQSWRANFNFGDAASALEQAQVSYWRLLHDTSNLINVEIHTDHPDRDRWAQTIMQNFNRFIEDWGDEYVLNYLNFSRNHLLYGVGPILFPNRDTARWKPVRTNDIMVPDRAPASSSNQDILLVKEEFSISQLWERIRTEENKKASTVRGWNVDGIKKLLNHSIRGNKNTDTQDWVKVEDRIRNKSTQLSEEHGMIEVVTIYVKEWDGKVSKIIFSDKFVEAGFIFDDYNTSFRGEDISDDISFVFFEVGNGMFHSVRGFGYKNYQTSIAMNRLKCKILDRCTIEGLNFRDNSEGTRTTIPILNMGAYNIVPRDLEQLPNYPGSSSIRDAIGIVNDTVNFNNARYRDQSSQIENTDTATQARILANLQSQVEVSNSTLYLKQFAKNIMAKQLERLMRRGNDDPDAKLFQERCLKGGLIPKEALHTMEYAIGTGADPGRTSAALQAEITFQLLQLASNDVDKTSAIEGYLESTLGASSVKRYIKPRDELEDPSSKRLAQLENTSLGDGVPIEVSQRDDHVVHIMTHIEPLMQIVGTAQTVEEGQIGMPANAGIPQQPSLSQEQMIALETSLPHIETHLQYLSQDEYKNAEYQELSAVFKQLQSTAMGMIRKIQEVAMAFANQQQFGEPEQLPNEPTQEFIPEGNPADSFN